MVLFWGKQISYEQLWHTQKKHVFDIDSKNILQALYAYKKSFV